MSGFGEILGEFKRLSMGEAENIVPIMDNEELTNGLIAWKSVPIQYKNNVADCDLQKESGKWEWMWQNVEFDMSTFAIVSGVKQQDAGRLFMRLKGLRLIYPDGTINMLAKQYLQAQIMSKLNKVSKLSKPSGTPPAGTPPVKQS